MTTHSISDIYKAPAHIIEFAAQEPILITKRGAAVVVILSATEYRRLLAGCGGEGSNTQPSGFTGETL